MGHRLVLLAAAGMLLTAAVVGTALVSLSQVSAVNRELTAVSHALHAHKTADELHDALRADVARAQLVADGTLPVTPAALRREHQRHIERFRAALDRIGSLRLPDRLKNQLQQLRPIQDTYIATTHAMVTSALSPRGLSLGAQLDYEVAFQSLVPEQNRITRELVATTRRLEREAAAQRVRADQTILLAGILALIGWLALAGWHYRSLRRLRAALLAEGQQRAAADLLEASLLPERLPTVSGAGLAATTIPGEPGQRVGGDWYDAFHLPTGQVCLVVGDVVGHGLMAASAMGQLRNTLRAYALLTPAPATVLRQVNQAALLLETCDLATCLCVILDPETKTARWASAGHPPPVVSRVGHHGRLLAADPGPPLGVTETAEYAEHRLQLHEGDHLLLYTDGLVESRNTPIDVGMAALERLQLPVADLRSICAEVISAMARHHGHDDDVTCLLLQLREDPTGPANTRPSGTVEVNASAATRDCA